ncbi:MAG TPA: CDP-diacylglycerol diphosphatase [Verrucomicrobiae bacterium]|nr:CDP-diacylglycerol diphosphatase [Verrucomicrobiae bacterium]
MRTDPLHATEQGSLSSRSAVFRKLALFAIFICSAFLLAEVLAGQIELPRNALWEVVHNVCVPGQLQIHDPKPCLKVDLNGGVDRGFAILRDPRGGTQFLLIPTARISGIESPIVREMDAANYFAYAWEVRTNINEALRRDLRRDEIGLAINSGVSRSQDQLHIHFSCIRAEVFETLHKNERQIGSHWARFKAPLYGQHYMAMWVSGENLSPHNPFRLLAEGLPNATLNMADRTLVVIGFTRSEGTHGFVILAGELNIQKGDLANGEDLLDNSCDIAAKGNS